MSDSQIVKNRPKKPKGSLYLSIIERVFSDRYVDGANKIDFQRADLVKAAISLGIKVPANLGDVNYSQRFRTSPSGQMLAAQPPGFAWRIVLAGHGRYAFVLGKESRIVPNSALVKTDIPDATPEIITQYALGDEQALLAVVRYNRLIDTFLSLTTYSLQSHLRTTVKGVGQIEIDELYIGLDSDGQHYVVPVQAKGGTDQISVVQTEQDMRACLEKFSGVRCRPVSIQFLPDGTIAMFELTVQDEELRVVQERHYRLTVAEHQSRTGQRRRRATLA